MLDDRFVIVGAGLAFISCLLYALDTFKGRTKPNRVTWFLWALAPGIAFVAQIAAGVGLPALLTLAIGFGPLLVLLASFRARAAYFKITRLDIICGLLSTTALILWAITGSASIAILFSILADFLASVPTIVKAYISPQTESVSAYLGGYLGGLITLLTISNWTIDNYAFAMYITLNMGLIAFLVDMPGIRFGRRKRSALSGYYLGYYLLNHILQIPDPNEQSSATFNRSS